MSSSNVIPDKVKINNQDTAQDTGQVANYINYIECPSGDE